MAKLTKADVARHLHISRQTLYDWIRKGRISVDPDGYIDSAEVARLSGRVRAPDVKAGRPAGHPLTSSPPDSIARPDLLALLMRQLEEAQADKRFLQGQVDRLTAILDRRLLEAPRTVAPAEASRPSPRPRTDRRALWHQVLAYLREHPGPQRALDVEQALGLETPGRFVLGRMVQAGLLRRVGPGVYALEEAGCGVEDRRRSDGES